MNLAEGIKSSFAEIVADWVVAEAASPSFKNKYAILPAPLLKKIARGKSFFTPSEIDQMYDALRFVRGSLLEFYQIEPAAEYRRVAVGLETVKKFQVISSFPGHWPDLNAFTVYELATGRFGLMPLVKQMTGLIWKGQYPRGLPLAVQPASGPPILIEGYKRCMLAISCGIPQIEIFVRLPLQAR